MTRRKRLEAFQLLGEVAGIESMMSGDTSPGVVARMLKPSVAEEFAPLIRAKFLESLVRFKHKFGEFELDQARGDPNRTTRAFLRGWLSASDGMQLDPLSVVYKEVSEKHLEGNLR